MKLGRLFVHATVGRRWHTQSKWPDGGWRTDYFEGDYDWKDEEPQLLKWDNTHEETITRRKVVIKHRVVSCYLMQFRIQYRSFSLKIENCTRFK